MRAKREAARESRALVWPGDPESVTAADIDFEALAHVLANHCRRSGHLRHYHSLAAHAVRLSEEIEALDGLDAQARRRLALHALLSGAASAWFRGEGTGSARAADRTAKLGSGIERSVREAAGLEAAPDDEQAELLRFVSRMAAAAESRDLMGAGEPSGAGIAFPPLKRRIRPMAPERAAAAWLERLRSLAGPDAGRPKAANGGGAGGSGADPDERDR